MARPSQARTIRWDGLGRATRRFQWGKQVASHLGGTRDPLVVYWPDRIKDAGGIRSQFHHLIDIAPTLLEAAHLPEPTWVDGVRQQPIEGISMVYSFDDASAVDRRFTQYFEMFANRAIYHDGWIAAARGGRLPWVRIGDFDFEKQPWELYQISLDYSERWNLAKAYPRPTEGTASTLYGRGEKISRFPAGSTFKRPKITAPASEPETPAVLSSRITRHRWSSMIALRR